MQRAPGLQEFLDKFVQAAGISADFVTASDHPGSCTCPICFDWWVEMGDPEAGYGPFDPALVQAEQKARGIEPIDLSIFMDPACLGIDE